MPVYTYKGLDERGREVKGMRDAESLKSLRSVLKREGVRIVEQREAGAVDAKKDRPAVGRAQALAKKEIDFKKIFDRVTSAEVALVTRQLAVLLRSGITLIESLGAIVDQVETEKLKKIFGQLKTSVNEGSSLGTAMAQHPAVFDELYVSMIRAGEASGALDQVLTRLADFLEAQARLRSKVTSALMYPIIMAGLGSVVMLILFLVVIPKITKIFEQVKAALPIQTKLLIFMADLLTGFWWALLMIAGAGVYYFERWRKSKAGRAKWDRFRLWAPVVGSILRLVAVARFARTLATLLRSGVPVLGALDISKDVLGNVRLAEVISEARDAIREGESIADPLKRSREFPPIVVHMIATGEKSGQLEEMLENVAENYDFQVDQKVGRLTTLIEPIMILAMGGAVGFVVWSVLMPILQLSQHVRG